MNIRQEIINIKDSIIHWRRDFHQYPELALRAGMGSTSPPGERSNLSDPSIGAGMQSAD